MVGRNVTIYRNPLGQAAASASRTSDTVTKSSGQAAGRAGRRDAPGIASARELVRALAGTYGMAYQMGPEKLVVTVPGEQIPVTLSDTALSGMGVVHEAGAAEMIVNNPGDYMIGYALYIRSDTEKSIALALQADGQNIAGSARDFPLRAGYQEVTGFIMAKLSENSRIRVVLTAASPLEVTLAGSGTTASLSIQRL